MSYIRQQQLARARRQAAWRKPAPNRDRNPNPNLSSSDADHDPAAYCPRCGFLSSQCQCVDSVSGVHS